MTTQTTAHTVAELIAYCDKEIASCKSVADAALEAFGHDNNRPIQEKKAGPYISIRTRLLAAQEMAEAISAILKESCDTGGLPILAGLLVDARKALKAWEGK